MLSCVNKPHTKYVSHLSFQKEPSQRQHFNLALVATTSPAMFVCISTQKAWGPLYQLPLPHPTKYFCAAIFSLLCRLPPNFIWAKLGPGTETRSALFLVPKRNRWHHKCNSPEFKWDCIDHQAMYMCQNISIYRSVNFIKMAIQTLPIRFFAN